MTWTSLVAMYCMMGMVVFYFSYETSMGMVNQDPDFKTDSDRQKARLYMTAFCLVASLCLWPLFVMYVLLINVLNRP